MASCASMLPLQRSFLFSCKSCNCSVFRILNARPCSTWNVDDKTTSIKECYSALNVAEDCTLQELKDSFISLAKRYHPDGKTETADGARFAQVESAYKLLREHLLRDQENSRKLQNEGEEKDYGIKHTAPQHRQYLSYDGVGYGTVSQRQRQYQAYKVSRAVDTVHEHRIQTLAAQNENSLIFKDKKEAKKHKIRNAIDRLVEDLIQESMAKGDFDNLPGNGKPLKNSPHNPYIDSVTQKLNEVLISNGFTPEWILLEKEIRNEVTQLRERLADSRARFGPLPLTGPEAQTWTAHLETLRSDVDLLNSKINKFNLVVPTLQKQMVCFLLEKESKKVLEFGKTNLDVPKADVSEPSPHSSARPQNLPDAGAGGFLGMFSQLLRG